MISFFSIHSINNFIKFTLFTIQPIHPFYIDCMHSSKCKKKFLIKRQMFIFKISTLKYCAMIFVVSRSWLSFLLCKLHELNWQSSSFDVIFKILIRESNGKEALLFHFMGIYGVVIKRMKS